MDKLLQQLQELSSGTTICGLYLGRATHADNVHATAFSAMVTEEQSWIIHDFSTDNGLNPTATKKTIYTYWTTQLRPHLKLCILATCGLTIHLQDRVWNQTSIRPDDNSLLLAPRTVS